MDLTKEYMHKQGTLGELKEITYYGDDQKLIVYSEEGSYPDYLYTSESNAEDIVARWAETGELIITDYSYPMGEEKVIIKKPYMVHIFSPERSFTRSIKPKPFSL